MELCVGRGSQADIVDEGRAEGGIIIHLELVVIEDGVERYRNDGPLEGGRVIGDQGVGGWCREQWDAGSIRCGEGTDFRPVTGAIGSGCLHPPVESGTGSQVGAGE